MANIEAMNYARSAASYADMVYASDSQTEIAIGQAIHELAKAIEEIARHQD